MIAATDALGQTVNYEYDSLGRAVVEKAPFEKGKFSVTKKYYDNNGNLIKAIDPDGYISKQYFNERNFLTATERVINGNKSNITKFNYDKEGNATKVIKGLNSFNDSDYTTYTYNYDSLNRLVMMADAANKKTYYEYDDNGNLTRLTDRNNVTASYEYDGLNRLVEKKNSKDGSKNTIKMSYDKLGNTRKMVDASGTTKFDYDSLGRLTKIDYGNGIKQNYTYDTADRVASMKVMQGTVNQMNLGYSYDKVGRLTKVNDSGKWFQYEYNQIGQLTEESNGVTGIKSAYQYYPSGSIKNLRHFNGKDIVSGYEYKYDRRGNQIEKNEGEGTTKYYYDALSRIKTAVMPEGAIQNYEYDDLDNISKLAEIQGNKIEETSYTYDKNSRLLLQETQNGSEVKQNRFSYDLNGNQLTKDEVIKRNGNTVSSKSTQFWYDGYNQLKRVQDANSMYTEYIYNGNGLRTKKESGDKATNYIYDGGANIIMETDQDNKVAAKNIRGLKLIYRESYANSMTDPTFLYYLHNAHGDVTQLLNEQGEVIKDYQYDPFGEEQSVESLAFGGKQSTELWRQEIESIDNPFRYAGEYQDIETGNYYLRARYYDPSTQRFINEDSFGVEKGAAWLEHIYGYGNNNPLKFIDPTGHDVSPTANNTKNMVRIYGPPAPSNKKATTNTKAKVTTSNTPQIKGSDRAVSATVKTSAKAATPAKSATPAKQGAGNSVANAMNNFNDKYIAGPLNNAAKKAPQAVESVLSNSPVYNLSEAISGKSLITGDLTPEQCQAKADLFTNQIQSGLLSLGMSGVKTVGPNFVVSPGGTAIPIPEGAVGPGSVNTNKGFSYTGGLGGNGLDSRVTGVRIMDPTNRYPNGYAVFMNKMDQTVNPLTGKTTQGKTDPMGHIPLK